MNVVERVPASRKLGRQAAEALLAAATTIVVVRGKNVRVFSPPGAPTPAERREIIAALLGPTGNLRAPTLRRGPLVLVGFDEASYREHLG